MSDISQKKERRRAYRRGHRAEWYAAFSLLLRGYRITARRFKTPVGEIDIIARKRNLILFVEVKARADERTALESVSPRARDRIKRAARWWLARQKDGAQLSWRFDIIAVLPRRWPVHFENVW